MFKGVDLNAVEYRDLDGANLMEPQYEPTYKD